jgi:hypothetical protein
MEAKMARVRAVRLPLLPEEEKAHRLVNTLKAEFANHQTVPLHIATDETLAGFDPIEGRCHDNARRWVAEHPYYRLVEGWITDNPDVLFDKHTAVVEGDGPVICVTLVRHRQSPPRQFLIHRAEWSPEAFAKLPNRVPVPLTRADNSLAAWVPQREPDADG